MYIAHDKDYCHLPIDGWSTRLQTCLESNIFPKKKIENTKTTTNLFPSITQKNLKFLSCYAFKILKI